MAKSGAQRAKEWRLRKKEKRQHQINIYLEPESRMRLESLQAQFSESITAIISRALKCLDLQSNKKINEHTLDRIVTMRDKDNLSFDEIVETLNYEGHRAFAGKSKWHTKTVEVMYQAWKAKSPTLRLV